MPNELKQYVVIKTDFDHLENWLNSIGEEYHEYHLLQVLPEHSYDGALAVIILELDAHWGCIDNAE